MDVGLRKGRKGEGDRPGRKDKEIETGRIESVRMREETG